MDYEIKKVVEEVDMLSLSESEYEKLNEFYSEIITKRFPKLAQSGQVYDVQRIIMTDGLSRIEVAITIKGQEPKENEIIKPYLDLDQQNL